MRVETFDAAMEFASTVLTSANNTSHHALPQNLCANTRGGSSADPAIELTRSTPQPFRSPVEHTINRIAKKTTEPMRARGTLRRGFTLSSATGAAPSQPEYAKREKITARNRFGAEPNFPGSSGPRLNPPAPGSKKP